MEVKRIAGKLRLFAKGLDCYLVERIFARKRSKAFLKGLFCFFNAAVSFLVTSLKIIKNIEKNYKPNRLCINCSNVF